MESRDFNLPSKGPSHKHALNGREDNPILYDMYANRAHNVTLEVHA